MKYYIEKTRDAVGLSLSVCSMYAAYTEHEKLMMTLPYFFLGFFVLDLPLASDTHRIHHAIGIAISVYNALVGELAPMINVILATEYSTPFYYALFYVPKEYKPPLKTLFFASFYTYRIQNFGLALVRFNAFQYPYPIFGLCSLYSLFALNLLWFSIMVKRLSFDGRCAAALFIGFSMYVTLISRGLYTLPELANAYCEAFPYQLM
jgi:hypothetical protein